MGKKVDKKATGTYYLSRRRAGDGRDYYTNARGSVIASTELLAQIFPTAKLAPVIRLEFSQAPPRGNAPAVCVLGGCLVVRNGTSGATPHDAPKAFVTMLRKAAGRLGMPSNEWMCVKVVNF